MKLLNFVSRWMGELLIGAIVIGYFVPALSVLKPIVSPLLMFFLFSSFLSMEFQIHKFIRKELLFFPILCWLILPLVIYFASLNLNLNYRIGLLLIVITPPALGSPILVRLAKGDLEFCVANLVLYNLISPITYALLPHLFFREISKSVSSFNIFSQVALFIFMPLLLSMIVKKTYWLKEGIQRYLDPLKGVIQLLMIAIVIASSSARIKEVPLEEAFIIFSMTLAISFFLYIFSYYICRKDKVMKYTCPISSGHKNTLLSIVTGMNHFNPLVSLPSVFYLISHHIWNGLVIYLSNKGKLTRKEESIQNLFSDKN